MYREISETVNLNSASSHEIPVEISGEIEVSETDIAADADETAETVHEVSNALAEAIEETLAEYEEDL